MGRVAGVANAEVANETTELSLIEDRGDETHVFHHHHVLAVGDRLASGLLTTVLEGVEAVEDQV